MAVRAPGDSPIDSAWRTRIPPGWQQFPDGSIGPPNQIGSDWNAPYRAPDRTASGVNPPSPSQLGRNVVPGGMGYPAAGVGPPNAGGGGGVSVPADLSAQVTPGTSLNTTGPDTGASGAHVDPSTGQPEMLDDPNLSSKSNLLGFNPANLLGGGNPYWKAAIAAAGAAAPTPANAPEAPTNAWFQRPSGVGGMPGPQVTNQPPGPAPPGVGGPYVGGQGQPPQMGMPWAGNNAGRPYGVGPSAVAQPAATPAAAAAPSGGGRGRIAPQQVNLGRGVPGVPGTNPSPRWGDAPQTNSPFTMVLRPNAPANNQGGRGGGGPALSTALDLSGYVPQPWSPPQAPAAPRAAPRPVARAPVRGPLAKPAPYPVTESGSPTPLPFQHGGAFPVSPGLVGYGGAGVTQADLDRIGVQNVMPP